MDSDIKEAIKDFLVFMVDKMDIKRPYSIKLTSKHTDDFKTYAYYSPSNGEIHVYIKNRGCADLIRSIAHELVHHWQNQNGKLKVGENIPDIGGEIEDEANALAGQLVKEFGYMSKHKIYEI